MATGSDSEGPPTADSERRATEVTQNRWLGAAEVRVAELRHRHASIDASIDAVERLQLFGGTLMASALAYRLFLAMLPLALVLVGALGFARSASDGSPEEIAHQLGTTGVVAQSIAESAQQAEHGRWWMLIIGTILLLWACYSLARSLRTVHALAWGLPVRLRGRAVTTTLVTLGFLALVTISIGLESRLATEPVAVRVLGSAAGFILVTLAWMAVTWVLPRGPAPLGALLPGALLFAVGVKAVHIFFVYWLAPHLDRSSQLYGALGVAATILLAFFLYGIVVVSSATLDAALWHRRQARAEREKAAAGE